MKKLITLVLLVVAMSVTAQVHIHKAYFSETTTSGEWNTDSKMTDIENNEVYVIFDMNENEIRVTNGFEDKFIIRGVDKSSTRSKQGNIRVDYVFDCIDKEGKECYATMSYYEKDGIAFAGLYDFRWGFFYSNIWYRYYCNVKSVTPASKKTDGTVAL